MILPDPLSEIVSPSQNDGDKDSVSVVDPTGGFADALGWVHAWPGVQVWGRGTSSVFWTKAQARDRLNYLRKDLARVPEGESKAHVERWLSYIPWTDRLPTLKPKRVKVLHLSDLHFGLKSSAANEEVLLEQLRHDVAN
jgi:hypothetical protein